MLKHGFIYSRSMQNSVFAIGKPSPRPTHKPRTRVRSKTYGYVPIVRKANWIVLPSHRLQGYSFWIETLQGESFFTKRAALLQSMSSMETQVNSPWTFPNPPGPSFQDMYLEKAEIVLGLLHTNQQIRWKFKRFFTRLRVQRFSQLNDHDPITLETIQQPISVPLFSLRKTYVFEAKSFAKLVHKQLLTNDGQIPTPVYPKNPLTNEAFPLAQLLSLLYQCKGLGHTSWIMELFLQCRCELARLLQLQSKPLRLNALRITMSDSKSWDCIDTLYDFIKSQHFSNNIPFQKNVYRWAVTHGSSAPRMEAWKRLCTKWYEIDILYDDLDTKEMKQDTLAKDILNQCTFPHDLKELHTRSLQ